MSIAANIKVPCNCFGTLGQFELEQCFHEMGIPGCKNSGKVLYEIHDEIAVEVSPKGGHDPVTKPDHYRRFKIEPVRFIMENQLPFWMGNVIKYILRHDAKNGLEDMRKARRYLDMEIARMEGNEDFWT